MASSTANPVPNILLLGIGNILLCDEGAGVHALRSLEGHRDVLTDVEFLDGGTLSFTLAGPIEACDGLIVLDAAELEASPGSVQVFEGSAMDEFLGANRRCSVHEVGLIDLMAIAALAGHLPERRALIGIQPALFGWGEAPSDAVAKAIPKVCRHALELVERWRS